MIRVLTYNIFTGHDLAHRLDLGRTADVIAAAQPDVVALQEVDRHYAERSEYADQAAVLAERLGGWSYGFAPGMDWDPEPGHRERRQFGEAILTPHRLVEFAAHRLENLPSDHPELEVRGVAAGVIDVDGRAVNVFNTHLDHLWPEQRLHQGRQVHTIAAATDVPTIIAGDLNAARDSAEVEAVADGFVDAAAGLSDAAALTWPSDVPQHRLDYVFVRGLIPVRAAVLDVRASDHRPVLVELDWA